MLLWSDEMAVAYVTLEIVLIALLLLLILRLGLAGLDTASAIGRDGLRIGSCSPEWRLRSGEVLQRGNDRWQLLIFSDHSLVSFPELVGVMNRLWRLFSDPLDVLVLSRDSPQILHAVKEGLNLEVDIAPVDQTVYDRFRVRVMPFAYVVDTAGSVRWRGLVNTEDHVLDRLRYAGFPFLAARGNGPLVTHG